MHFFLSHSASGLTFSRASAICTTCPSQVADCGCLLQNAFIPLQQSTTVGTFADKIGALRALLSGADDETPLISADGTPSIVTADSNAIAFSRTPQVSDIAICLSMLALQFDVFACSLFSKKCLQFFVVEHMPKNHE